MSTLAARLLAPRRPGIKPRPGVWRLKRQHPLAIGLAVYAPFTEGCGAPVNLADGRAFTVNTGMTWGSGVAGAAIQGDGTNALAFIGDGGADPYAPIQGTSGAGTGGLTLACLDATASAATGDALFTQGEVEAGITPGIGIYVNATARATIAAGQWCLVTANATLISNYATTSATVVDGNPHVRVAVRADSGGAVDLYQDGALLDGAIAGADRDVSNTAQRLTVGTEGNLSTRALAASQPVFLIAAWNRALSAAEVLAFSLDPWSLLELDPPLWPVGFDALAGGTTVPYVATAQASPVAFAGRKTVKPMAAALAATGQISRKASKGVLAGLSGAVSAARSTFKGLAATASAATAFVASLIASLLGKPARLALDDSPATAFRATDTPATTLSTGDAPATILTIGDAGAA